MFSLENIFKKAGALSIFFFLQIICLLLVINHNEVQGNIFWSSANGVIAGLNQAQTNLTERFNYKNRYDSLLQVHQELLSRQPQAYFDNRILRDSVGADSAGFPKYTYTAAEVIKNSYAQKNNFLTVNRGSDHGIQPHMGVVADDGIIGVVRAVSNHYALVMSVLHTRNRITAEVKNKGHVGTLTWDGEDPAYMNLKEVPRQYFLEVGDTIQTSNFSRIYPAGQHIGVIEEFTIPEGASTYNIRVKLFKDLRKVKNVYVVKHLLIKEINELEQQIQDE